MKMIMAKIFIFVLIIITEITGMIRVIIIMKIY